MRVTIQFKSREEQHSHYDWADILSGDDRVGKARCKIDQITIIIHTITIYPEYAGLGYGKEFVKYCKENYQVIVADRVRYSAIGFWETLGFTDNKDGCWIFNVIPLKGEI